MVHVKMYLCSLITLLSNIAYLMTQNFTSSKTRKAPLRGSRHFSFSNSVYYFINFIDLLLLLY
jgi:hypothetical protein